MRIKCDERCEKCKGAGTVEVPDRPTAEPLRPEEVPAVRDALAKATPSSCKHARLTAECMFCPDCGIATGAMVEDLHGVVDGLTERIAALEAFIREERDSYRHVSGSDDRPPCPKGEECNCGVGRIHRRFDRILGE